MWATEMGRDLLGDNLPPDEINIVDPSTSSGPPDYGWPHCYGKNEHDNDYDKAAFNHCAEPAYKPSHIDLPAHSAPLGLAFIPNWPQSGWPKDYAADLLVAYHGSWNRSEPTGYKIVRIKLGDDGKLEGIEDFITGWLSDDGKALGRPVDITIRNDGTAYISDDKAGVIYKLSPIRNDNEPVDEDDELLDKVHLDTPKTGAKVTSPLVVEGEARGSWFFEASFPIKIEDSNGKVLGQSFVQAQDNWMTIDFVPFSGKIEFSTPETSTGTLVLQKDNPSGLPEFDEEIRVPIKFK